MTDTTPAEAETQPPGTVEITFDGHTYEIPASLEDVDIDVIEAFEQGQAVGGVKALLGPAVWERVKQRYRASHGGRFPAPAIEPLGEEIARVYGFKTSGE